MKRQRAVTDRNRSKAAYVGTSFAVLLQVKCGRLPYSKWLGSFSLEWGVNRINTGMIIHVGRWQRKIFNRIKKKKEKDEVSESR
jgi:hypothetical protein